MNISSKSIGYMTIELMLNEERFSELNNLCKFRNLSVSLNKNSDSENSAKYNNCKNNNVLIDFRENDHFISSCTCTYNSIYNLNKESIMDLLMLFLSTKDGSIHTPNISTVKKLLCLRIATIDIF